MRRQPELVASLPTTCAGCKDQSYQAAAHPQRLCHVCQKRTQKEAGL